MSRQKTNKRRLGLRVGLIGGILLIFTFFFVTMMLAFSWLTSSASNLSQAAIFPGSLARPGPTPSLPANATATPDPAALITFRSVALGFSVAYPASWRRNEKALQVILSPSPEGLDPAQLQAASLWVGIPADNSFEPGPLLAGVLAGFPAETQISSEGSFNMGGQNWTSAQLSFMDENLGGPAIATIAVSSRNEVGYYLVAVAPAEQWSALQPTFQEIMRSFRFTQEAVIRPTDATPPPTPTPSPTPRVYIVQSGDTLGGIAAQFGVSVESLANRNGIEKPEYLQTGAKLIIPTQR